MVRSRSRPTKVGLRTPVEVSLLMVCEEEELSPIQKSEQRKAMQAYREFTKKIEEYRANNATIEYLKTPLTPAEITALEAKPVITVEEHVTGTVIPAGGVTPVGTVHTPQNRTVNTTQRRVTPQPRATPSIQPRSKPALATPAPGPAKGARSTVSPSNRPQRKAAKAAMGLIINEAVDMANEQEDDDDDVIIVNESMARNPPPSEGKSRSKGKGAKVQSVIPSVVPTAQGMTSPVNVPKMPALNQVTHIQIVRQDGGAASTKRGASVTDTALQPKRKQKKVEEEQGNWVPLDEYYYGKKEGDPAYREEKGEYRFKCWYCHKMLYNNLRIMMHMQGHIDSEKQQNLDLADLTQCKHCYKQFDTPFEMQNHVEKVHQSKSNVLVCRICEKDHENQAHLRQHMKVSHNACEMPYICQLCNFRSSVYTDVVDHFKKRHDSSQCVLCLYCLKVFKVVFSKTSGWGLTQNYYQHLQKHQSKINNKKCPCCKLTFINKLDVKIHRQRDHLPNFRGAISGSGSRGDDVEIVMIKLPSDNKTPKVKSLNAPTTSKVQEIRAFKFSGVSQIHKCFECGHSMLAQDHYKRYVECSLCRYATLCNDAYSTHMMTFHSGKSATRRRSVPEERQLEKKWYCLCGYQTNRGNRIANHLVICSKRTAYLTPPEQKFFEYDDEQEEFNPFEPYEDEPCSSDKTSPEREVPSLFGALGLVRKQDNPALSKKELSPSSESKSGQGVTKSERPQTARKSGKAPRMQQETQAVPPKPSPQASATDEVPPELTGAKKWSTVHIKDGKTPTKASVFLGSQEDEKTEAPTAEIGVKSTEKDANSPSTDEILKTDIGEKKDVDDVASTDATQLKQDSVVAVESSENSNQSETVKTLNTQSQEADNIPSVDKAESQTGIKEDVQMPESVANAAETGNDKPDDTRASPVDDAHDSDDHGGSHQSEAMQVDHAEQERSPSPEDEVMLLKEGEIDESTEKEALDDLEQEMEVDQGSEDMAEGKTDSVEKDMQDMTAAKLDSVEDNMEMQEPGMEEAELNEEAGDMPSVPENGSKAASGDAFDESKMEIADKVAEEGKDVAKEAMTKASSESGKRPGTSEAEVESVDADVDGNEGMRALQEVVQGLDSADTAKDISQSDVQDVMADTDQGGMNEEKSNEIIMEPEGNEDIMEGEKDSNMAEEDREDNMQSGLNEEILVENKDEDIMEGGDKDSINNDRKEEGQEENVAIERDGDEADTFTETQVEETSDVTTGPREATETENSPEEKEKTTEVDPENESIQVKGGDKKTTSDDVTEGDDNKDRKEEKKDKESQSEKNESDSNKPSGSSAGETNQSKTKESEKTSDTKPHDRVSEQGRSRDTQARDQSSDSDTSLRSPARSTSGNFRSPDRSHGHQARQGSEGQRSQDRMSNQRRDDHRWQDQRQGNYRHDNRDRSHDRYSDNRHRQDGYHDNRNNYHRNDYHNNRQGGYNQNRDRHNSGGYNQRGGQRGGFRGNDGYRGRGYQGGGYRGNRGGYGGGGYHGYY